MEQRKVSYKIFLPLFALLIGLLAGVGGYGFAQINGKVGRPEFDSRAGQQDKRMDKIEEEMRELRVSISGMHDKLDTILGKLAKK